MSQHVYERYAIIFAFDSRAARDADAHPIITGRATRYFSPPLLMRAAIRLILRHALCCRDALMLFSLCLVILYSTPTPSSASRDKIAAVY